MARRSPKLRKCRACWRNFPPTELVAEALEHDDRGYPIPIARWCPPCADERLDLLATDPRDADARAHLADAVTRWTGRQISEATSASVDTRSTE